MTRFIGIPDSVLSSQSDFLNTGILTGVATGAIAAGELCMITESAKIMRVDPNLPWAAINQSNPSPYQVYVTAKWVNVSFTTMTVLKACGYPARCINRNYMVPCQSSLGIGFIIRSAAGLEISNFILASADTSTCVPYAHPLANGNWVLMWHTGASLKFMIFDGQGVQIAGATTVSTLCLTSGMVPWHGHCSLNNGNFAITFATTGGALVGIVYGPTGTLVTAQFTIDAASTGQEHVCAPCANGEFLVGCFDASHTKHSLYRCNNGGTTIWGPISRSPATTAFSVFPDAARQHPQHNRLCELNGPNPATPNICWQLPNAAGHCNSYVHSSTGALVKACDVGTSYHNINCRDPVTQTPYGFCVAHAPNTGVQTCVSFFDWSGNAIGQNHEVERGAHQFPIGQSPNMCFYTGWCGTGVVISRYCGGNTYGGIECRVIHCDPHGYCIGTPYNHQDFGPDDMCAPCPNPDWDGTAHICVFTAATLQISASLVKVGRSSVLGVAQASAADGASVTVVGQGYFTLPTTQVFGPGVAFDQRMAPVPGCRGVVAGNAAILFGWAGSIAAAPALPPAAPTPIITLTGLSQLSPAQLSQVQALINTL